MKFITILLLATNISFAGVFSSEPPPDFKNSKIFVQSAGGQEITVGEFYAGLEAKDGGTKRSWSKQADGEWILNLVVNDKMAGKKHEMKILFENKEGMAVIKRFFAGGEEVPPVMHPNFLLPMIQGIDEKSGKAQKRRNEDSQRAKAAGDKKLKSELAAIPGHYYHDAEQIEVIKVSEDTVKANFSVSCSPLPDSPVKIYKDQVLKLFYSKDWQQYQAKLKIDKCDLLVKFGHGQMDTIQGVEFEHVDFANRGDCCVGSRFTKRSKATEEMMAKNKTAEVAEQGSKQSEANEKISAVIGHYEHPDSSIGGTFDVTSDSASTLKIGYAKKGCSFTDKTVSVQYDAYAKNVKGTLKETDCELSVMANGTSLQISEGQGTCKSFCSRVDGTYSLDGNYNKK